jgi:two-component system, oxyanion-binding sensor
MVDSLASRQIDGFCVGAPWNSLAVELGVGRILHFGCDIIARAPEKALAVRAGWAVNRADVLERLLRAIDSAAAFVNNADNVDAVAALLAAPHRVGAPSALIRSALEGRLHRVLSGPRSVAPNYMLIGRDDAARPDPIHAAWLYAQMVRWGQAPLSAELLAAAQTCFRRDLYDATLGTPSKPSHAPADGIGAFVGPPFDADALGDQVAAWKIISKPA